MRRGVLKLTPEELEIVIKLVTDSNYPTKTLLLRKLGLAQESSDTEKHVDINEEDVEVMLDMLGIPMANESQEQANLRTKLQNLFLNVLG